MGGGFGPGLPKSVRQRQRSCLFGRDLRSLWQTDFATPLMMTQYIAWWTCFGGNFPPFHLFTFPLSKIQSILSSAFYLFSDSTTLPRHHVTTKSSFPPIVAPIYYRGMGLICIPLSGVGHPAVILNPVRDDLRMMTPKPVAARDGAMKHIAECVGYLMRLSNN